MSDDRGALRRDRPDTAFSRILGSFLEQHEAALAAVLVDAEGECIDYATSLDPYDAKVFGAALLGTTVELVSACARSGGGQLLQWIVEASGYDMVVRRIGEEHVLVVVLASFSLSGRLLSALGVVAEALRIEAGLDAPLWDPSGIGLTVDMASSDQGEPVPRCVRQGARTWSVERVLGRWTERGAITAAELLCFRVRAAGEELTLVHDPSLARWHRR